MANTNAAQATPIQQTVTASTAAALDAAVSVAVNALMLLAIDRQDSGSATSSDVVYPGTIKLWPMPPISNTNNVVTFSTVITWQQNITAA